MTPFVSLLLGSLASHGWDPAPAAFIQSGANLQPQAIEAAPPGSRAAYERAEGLGERFRGLLVGTSPEPRWTAGGDLWVQVRRAPRREGENQGDLVVVDPVAGVATRRDLDGIASSIAVARGLESLDLELGRLERERDGSLRLLLSGPHGAWRLDADGDAVAPLALADLVDWRIPLRRLGGRSKDGGSSSGLLFVNRTDAPVELAWIDHDRRPKEHGTIAPGERLWMGTTAGHVFRIQRPDRERLGFFVAEERAGIAWIDGSAPEEILPEPERPTAAERAAAGDPSLKNDRMAFRRDHDLWLRSAVDGSETRVTRDGSEDAPYLGRALWSPHGAYLVARQVTLGTQREISVLYAAPEDSLVPVVHSFRYDKPGDDLAHPRLRLFAVEEDGTPRAIPIDDAAFPHPLRLRHLEWAEDGQSFTFLYDERGHQAVRWLRVDASSGAVSTLFEETTETFLNIHHKRVFQPLRERGLLLWASERTGWNHLELRDLRTGELVRPLTSGEWLVRSLESVDETGGSVLLRVRGYYPDQDPYHDHFLRVSLDDGSITPLTADDGTHAIEFSPDGAFYVDSFSRVDRPTVRQLRRTADGALVETLSTGDDSLLQAAGWRAPQRFVAKGRDGVTDIWGVVHRPTNFDPKGSYPVIEHIYAGPHDAHVPKSFRVLHSQQRLAELGFVVVQIDGMGTNWRSKAFHDVTWQNLHDSGFPDRIAWMRALAATDPALDLSRVGIYGGSAGGQSALRALIDHHDFYKAAAADCGCHDNRVDKVWWNEAWMGWPVGPHYELASNAAQAHRMEGDLLLTVGLLDRNVDPASTLQVVERLIEADKDFELITFPSGGHGSGESEYGRRRRKDFFVRSLLGVEPRWEGR